MKYFSIAIILIGFFTLIGFCCYMMGSAIPLWALILGPSIAGSITDNNEDYE